MLTEDMVCAISNQGGTALNISSSLQERFAGMKGFFIS